jgi:hypothetical protein
MKHPYSLPGRLSPDLERVRAYWQGLLRGGADMPFWDDAKLTDLPDLESRLFLIGVFARPERFRFETISSSLVGQDLDGVFLDETDLDAPLEFLRSQASATVECAAPTYFRREKDEASVIRPAHARLLLPMWGDGRIGMLLGAVDFS